MKFYPKSSLGSCIALILVSINIISCVPLNLRSENDSKIFYNVRGSFNLKCIVDEAVASEIQWFKNETNVKEVAELKERFVISTTTDNKESKFTINKAVNNDAGDYSCRLQEQKFAYDVIANVAVKLPSNSGVVEGEKLKLHCLTAGTEVTVKWTLPNNTTIADYKELVDNR